MAFSRQADGREEASYYGFTPYAGELSVSGHTALDILTDFTETRLSPPAEVLDTFDIESSHDTVYIHWLNVDPKGWAAAVRKYVASL